MKSSKEARKLTLDNMDLEHSQAIVTEKGQTRFLIFSKRTIEAITEYLHERPDVIERSLFIGQKLKPLGTSGVHSLLDRLATRAGVNGRHNPHAWRHGWARAALSNGADLGEVAQVLGHNQVQTTFEFYGRWDSEELHELHERYSWFKEEDNHEENHHK